jgi:site-specific recombinase XerD
MKTTAPRTPLGPLLQQFFVERLLNQRHASPRTVSAYRDCFRLFLLFAERQIHRQPANLALEDLQASLILQFLDHLEKERHNSIRSRNARFAAIRSFMQYAGYKAPAALSVIQSVLAIPMKRFDRPLVGFITRAHIEAIIAAPDPVRWTGRRDTVMFATLYNTGARVSELIGLRGDDLILAASPAVRILGKGRKERTVPLWSSTASQLRCWLRERQAAGSHPIFPNRAGGFLSRTTVAERLQLAVRGAAKKYPELLKRPISPHTFRHSIAMHMLQSGIDITVIALWLGHESPGTTHMYVEADLAMKERALRSVSPPKTAVIRFRPSDRVLQFLQSL